MRRILLIMGCMIMCMGLFAYTTGKDETEKNIRRFYTVEGMRKEKSVSMFDTKGNYARYTADEGNVFIVVDIASLTDKSKNAPKSPSFQQGKSLELVAKGKKYKQLLYFPVRNESWGIHPLKEMSKMHIEEAFEVPEDTRLEDVIITFDGYELK